jgi:hypothetical protein
MPIYLQFVQNWATRVSQKNVQFCQCACRKYLVNLMSVHTLESRWENHRFSTSWSSSLVTQVSFWTLVIAHFKSCWLWITRKMDTECGLLLLRLLLRIWVSVLLQIIANVQQQHSLQQYMGVVLWVLTHHNIWIASHSIHCFNNLFVQEARTIPNSLETCTNLWMYCNCLYQYSSTVCLLSSVY